MEPQTPICLRSKSLGCEGQNPSYEGPISLWETKTEEDRTLLGREYSELARGPFFGFRDEVSPFFVSPSVLRRGRLGLRTG